MNSQQIKRLEVLEGARQAEFKSFAFFEAVDNEYRHTETGRSYSRDEFLALADRHPDCAFLPVGTVPSKAEEFTLEDLDAWNRANEDADFDPQTHPNPRLRALALAAEKKEPKPDPFWDDQLRRMGRQDLIDLREVAAAHNERILSGEAARALEVRLAGEPGEPC